METMGRSSLKKSDNKQMIQFLKSPALALVSASIAWLTWGRQWAGAIPALAFMTAFYGVLWWIYDMVEKGMNYFSKGRAEKHSDFSNDKKAHRGRPFL